MKKSGSNKFCGHQVVEDVDSLQIDDEAEILGVEVTLEKIPDNVIKEMSKEKLDFLLSDIEFNENQLKLFIYRLHQKYQLLK